MGEAVFPPCYLTWGQTIVEVVKIMVTSFKRSHEPTATLSAPNPASGHHWPMPALETPGHSWASLSQSLVGSLLLSPGSQWKHKVLLVLSKSLFHLSCVSSGSSMVDLMVTSFRRAYSIPRSTAPRDPAPAAVHCKPIPPQETLKYSSVSVSVRSPGPGVHKVCLSPLSISDRYGVWFQTWFCPSYHLAGVFSLPLDSNKNLKRRRSLKKFWVSFF